MDLLVESRLERRRVNLPLAVVALGVIIALLYYGRLFFITVTIALTVAFLLDPLVCLFARARIPRSVGSFLACVCALLCLYLAGLGAYTQIVGMLDDLPAYSQRISDLLLQASQRLERIEQRTYELLTPRRPLVPPAKARGRRPAAPMPVSPATPLEEIAPRRPILARVYELVRSFSMPLLMASFVPFLVYFMLSWKDHLREAYLQLFPESQREEMQKSWERVATVFRAYVLGNFVLGLLLSVFSALFFWFMDLPYFLLAGVLSGFFSLVPYIGLPLAMVPPFFVALTVHTTLTPYVIIGTIVGVLHLLALNLLYPKIVGARVHLNPLAVTLALMVFGLLWGGIGFVLAIPITAGLKAVLDHVPGWERYGQLLGD